MSITYDEAKARLMAHGQAHVLEGFHALSEEDQRTLLSDIEAVDFSVIEAALQKKELPRGILTPMGALTLPKIEAKKDAYKEAGIKALRQGKAAALLLAGGMGTRLGTDLPKGELRVGIRNELCIFECLIRNLQEVTEEIGRTLPLFIMTSEKNDTETRRFFKEKDYFGYPGEEVYFFMQETAAAVDHEGKLLKEAPGRLSTSPNGNGGWFSSLVRAGLLPVLHEKGIEWLNLFAVDNVLQRILDPVFLGAVLLSGAESGGKVIPKADPEEKLGVLCKEDGSPSIVEYYEMTEDMRTLTDENGALLYRYGVILNYLFRVDKLEEIQDAKLPLHIVEKKIPYLDEAGTLIKPTEPNGYKFETLVLDMIHLMKDMLAFEAVREKEFAPIKNLHGVDSLDTARALLQKNGVAL